MTTVSVPTLPAYTPADVARLSDEHGKLYELVDGQLVEKLSMSSLSNWIASQLVFLLKSCYGADKAYIMQEQPTYCFETLRKMRRPDALLVWSHRLVQGLTHTEIHLAPDFVAEVVSPSNAWLDVRDRVEEYLRAGVPLVWVVEPDLRSVQAYRGDGSLSLYRANDTIQDEPLLPGLSLRVADIFPLVAQPAGSGP